MEASTIDILPLNLLEAEKILKCNLKTYSAIEAGAKELLTTGANSVLITDSYFVDNGFFQDYWTNGQTGFWLANKRFLQQNFSAITAVFSSALTTCLRLGYEIKDALIIAKMKVNRTLRQGFPPLQDKAARLSSSNWPEAEIDLPYVTACPIITPLEQCKSIDRQQLGLYPLVDSSHWLATLLPLGVKTLQLRIKDKKGCELENEIKRSIALAKKYQAKLFINDYWELAIQHAAYGVHLGQEDLATANIAQIRQAGLRLGISTHGYYEVARAHAFKPSYIACGPIFATTSKIMSCAAQGITQLKRWRRTLSYPLVAIGGINKARLPAILATQVDGIAMISAITQAKDPSKTTQELMDMINK